MSSALSVHSTLLAFALSVAAVGPSLAAQAPAPPAPPTVNVAQLQQAAARGDAKAEFDLAVYFGRDDVADRSDAASVDWLKKSAAHGFVDAQHTLGLLYLLGGRGVTTDPPQAAEWFRKAGDQGLPVAQYALAQLYAGGLGVAADPAQAVTWWRKAAEQGDARAQHSLALAYFNAEGVGRDLVEAYKWLYVAVLRTAGEERTFYVHVRDSVGTNMTGEQLAAAQQQAKAWAEAFAR